MCGIVGFVGRDLSMLRLEESVEALLHRGPDFGNSFKEWVGKRCLFFGHRRLSIIDLSDEGNQPMHEGEVSLVFNGEIYNFRELKAAHLGAESFHSNSDTEVVLKLYRKFGADFVHHLKGDFAMAIFDRHKGELLLIRDRVGVKPLYIYESDGLLGFSSEIKGFKHAGLSLSPREGGLGKFLVFKYSPGQDTLYKEVRRLAPGTILRLDLNSGKSTERKYWNLQDEVKPFHGSFDDAKVELRERLGAAIEARLVADVPIANYLSGGLDSSIIAYHLRGKEFTHYCAVKDERDLKAEGTTSDGAFAKKLADDWNLNLETISIGLDQLTPELIRKSIEACDDLIADGSIIPAMLIAERAAQKHRVVLSGMGADELFLGYNGHFLLKLTQMAQAVPGFKGLASPLLQKIKAGKGPFKAYRRYLQKWGNNLGKDYQAARFSVVGDVDSALSLLKRPPNLESVFGSLQGNDFESLFAFEMENFLVKNLHYLDGSSMAYGLESRVPYLDHELVTFAASLPVDFKLDNQLRSKKILKAAYADVLPADITKRRKAGFGMPLRSLLSKRAVLDQLLPYDILESTGQIDMDQLRKLEEAHISGKQDQSALIYALLVYGMSQDN
ncbi:MAG: asparagine synthase (glutamine-hydrolyzing) [Cryomorphaceae bacterium]|jgi:asparagine synthase (glutamine-hydrolysing)